MTVAQIIDISIYGVAALFIVIGMLLGFIRGFRRQTMRMISIIASVAIAYLVCKLGAPFVINAAGSVPVGQLLSSYVALPDQISAIINNIDSETLICIAALPVSIVLAPLLTIPIFYLLAAVLELLHKVICGILGFKRRDNNILTRFIGLIVGAAEGVILALVVIVPLSGIVSVATGAAANLKEKHPDSQNAVVLCALYDEYLAGAENNLIVNLAKPMTDMAYGMFSEVEISGAKVNVPKFVSTGTGLFAKFGDLTGTNWLELSEQSKASMTEMKDYISEDPYCAMLLSGALRAVGKSGDTGIIPIKFEAPFDKLFDELMEVITTSNKDNLAGDLDTTLGLYYLMSDEGVLVETNEGVSVMDALMKTDENGVNVFSRANEILASNERMNGVVAEMVNIAMSLLLEESGMDATAMETIANLKDGLNDTLAINRTDYGSDEEYRAAVTESLDGLLADNGIGLEAEQLDAVADYVINEMSGVENITDADIAKFMAKYYDEYTKSAE